MGTLKSIGKAILALGAGTGIVLIVLGIGAVLSVIGAILGVIVIIAVISSMIWCALNERKDSPPKP